MKDLNLLRLAELLEKTECELRQVIRLARKEGIPAKELLRLLPDIETDLKIHAEIEEHLTGRK